VIRCTVKEGRRCVVSLRVRGEMPEDMHRSFTSVGVLSYQQHSSTSLCHSSPSSSPSPSSTISASPPMGVVNRIVLIDKL